MKDLRKQDFSYIAFLAATLAEASDDAADDGKSLALDCLKQLKAIDNPEQFPPVLFILLLSPAYLDRVKVNKLLASIHTELQHADLGDIPMIGSTVGAVIFDEQVHERGALLICIATRQWQVNVAVGPNIREDPVRAANLVCDRIFKARSDEFEQDVRSPSERVLLTFAAGYRQQREPSDYVIDVLHEELLKRTVGRLPIVGGVSTAGHKPANQEAMQFANWTAFSSAVVCALIESGTPTATGTAHGFRYTGIKVRVSELLEEGRVIKRLQNESDTPTAVFRRLGDPVLLGEMSVENRLITVVPSPDDSTGNVHLHRRLEADSSLKVLVPDQAELLGASEQVVSIARKRSQLENPLAALLFCCTGLHRFKSAIGIDIGDAIKKFASLMQGRACVGGFFDGELGLDNNGNSIPTNWSIVSLIIGDELREASKGFKALAHFSPGLIGAGTLEDLSRLCVQLPFEAGYPGAMLSLLFQQKHPKDLIIAVASEGSKFQRIVDETRRPVPGPDLLAEVVRLGQPKYVPNLQLDLSAEQGAVLRSGLTSQYVIPLKARNGDLLAVLQIDLGNTSYRHQLPRRQVELLDAIGKEVASALDRFFSQEQLFLAKEFDRALFECMRETETQKGLERYCTAAVAVLKASEWHLRVLNDETRMLSLCAGFGPYYEEARRSRPELSLSLPSWSTEAFRDKAILLVNHATPELKSKLPGTDEPAPKQLVNALANVNAFAAIPFLNSHNDVVGILGLGSKNVSFFTKSRVKSLELLSTRLGFLVEYLDQKEREVQSQRRLKFQIGIAAEVPSIYAEEAAIDYLDKLVTRYSDAFGAEVASLFLHDDELDRLVLRAQRGWADRGWVHAARYQLGSGWPGIAISDTQPQHVANLNDTRRRRYIERDPHFIRHMVGGVLNENVKVECIAIPLSIAGRRLGILLLYARNTNDDSTRFTTIAPEDLAEAQKKMITAVSMVLAQLAEHRSKLEATQRESITRALTQLSAPPNPGPLLDVICSAYGADRVSLYLTSGGAEAAGTGHLTPAEARIRTDRDVIKPYPAPAPDELILQAAGPQNPRSPSQQNLRLHRASITPNDRKNPKLLATENLVDRACIPLTVEGALIGVLDICWNVAAADYCSRIIPRYNEPIIRLLGARVGAAFRRAQLEADAARNRLEIERKESGIKYMALMASQAGHRFGNILRGLRGLSLLMREARDEKERVDWLNQLDGRLEAGAEVLNRIRHDVLTLFDSSRTVIPLFKLLEQVMSECCRNYQPLKNPIPTVFNTLKPDLEAWANQELIEGCFHNVVTNALQAMPNGGMLRIYEAPNSSSDLIHIVVEDTGEGMTPVELQAAREGAVTTHTKRGIGLLLSKLLIQANGGDLDIESEYGSGTRVTITLPRQKPENANEHTRTDSRG